MKTRRTFLLSLFAAPAAVIALPPLSLKPRCEYGYPHCDGNHLYGCAGPLGKCGNEGCEGTDGPVGPVGEYGDSGPIGIPGPIGPCGTSSRS